MNEVMNAIKGRRSIRKYLPEQIKKEELDLILEAGTYAPSGHNEQPWHFTVVQNKEIIDNLSFKTKELMNTSKTDWIAAMAKNEKFNIFYNAPTIIVVSGEQNDNGDLWYSPLADCSAAIQNMLTAAQSIGIASCWIGLTSFLFDYKKGFEELNIPAGYNPLFTITLGYSAITKEIKPLARKENTINYIK